MPTITIPEVLSRNKDLVAVPRQVYDEFLAWQKKVKSVKTFKPTFSEKKAILRGRQNFAKGNYITFERLRHELASSR